MSSSSSQDWNFSTGNRVRRKERFFKNILEASIDSPVDLQHSIQRYQDSLQYARSQLHFVVGENLNLIPSDTNLRIGTYEGYNNNILIATSDLSLGSNQDMNSTPTVDVSSIDDQLLVSPPSSDDVNVELDERSDDLTGYDDKHQEEKNAR